MNTARVRVSVVQQQSVTPLWFANHETGDFSQWQGVWNNGKATNTIATSPVHSGRYSAKLTLTDVTSEATRAGTRLTENGRKWGPVHPEATTNLQDGTLPDSAYYSVWYYFPEHVTVTGTHWNIFQWKQVSVAADGTRQGSDPLYGINGTNRPDGSMYLSMNSHVGDDGGYNTPGKTRGKIAHAPINLPLRKWVHVEVLYTWRRNFTGQIRAWQDGVEIWNLQGIITEFSYPEYLRAFELNERPRAWAVNNYTSGTNPSTQTLYVDDAVIARERVYGR